MPFAPSPAKRQEHHLHVPVPALKDTQPRIGMHAAHSTNLAQHNIHFKSSTKSKKCQID